MFPAGVTTANQHSSSNPIVISSNESLHIVISVTSSSASCLFLIACVTQPNSITVGSVGAANPLLGFFSGYGKKACASHWHEYMYTSGWIQFCVPLPVFGLKLSFEVCIVATLDKMLESGVIMKSKMIPLCSLWQHSLNSFIWNTCFLWQRQRYYRR